MNLEQIVAAIRALPLAERLRVIEIVAHETANDVHPEPGPGGAVTLVDDHGLLVVDADAPLPADVFDHRLDREARADRVWGGVP